MWVWMRKHWVNLSLFAALVACHADTVRIPAEDNADAALTITCAPPSARVRFPAARGGYTVISWITAEDHSAPDAIPDDSLAVRFARTSPHWRTVAPGVMVADSANAVLREFARPVSDSVTLFVSTRYPPVAYRFPVWQMAGRCP